MSTAKGIGDVGETIAVDYLRDEGYRILDRNYRFQRSEVDIVCYDPGDPAAGDPAAGDPAAGGEIVFVEVKARSGLRYGAPEAAVTDEKQRSILKVSRAYLYERRMEGAPSRFDVVTVILNRGGDPDVQHHPDAFQP
jgi:putative endonuclease